MPFIISTSHLGSVRVAPLWTGHRVQCGAVWGTLCKEIKNLGSDERGGRGSLYQRVVLGAAGSEKCRYWRRVFLLAFDLVKVSSRRPQ